MHKPERALHVMESETPLNSLATPRLRVRLLNSVYRHAGKARETAAALGREATGLTIVEVLLSLNYLHIVDRETLRQLVRIHRSATDPPESQVDNQKHRIAWNVAGRDSTSSDAVDLPHE